MVCDSKDGVAMTETGFGELLRRFRLTMGLTQEELAERAGLSLRGVSDLERGVRRTPFLDTVNRLADALSLKPADRQALLAAARPGMLLEAQRAPLAGPAELPLPLTALIGREAEIAALRGLLCPPTVRLLTLTGPGGVGKTRLAIAVGGALAAEFRGAIAFVDLAPVRESDAVVSAIAQAVGVRESGARSAQDALVAALGDTERLLVLDNFEHVLAAAPLVSELLAGCPRLTILATSRAALRISGEHVYPVNPLALPDLAAGELALVAAAPAVRLFVARAAAVDSAFTLREDSAAAVAAICVGLDGLPLAIELAAARSKMLPPALLLPRLARRLPLLSGGPRDAPARLQTMREAIAWSHDLLTPDEQVLFRRLAVFVAGFGLDAAESVCQGTTPIPEHASASAELDSGLATMSFSIPDGIDSLMDKSLLRWTDSEAGGRRFGMLETIREFAWEQLAASGESDMIRAAHARYFANLATDIEAARTGLADPRLADAMTAEVSNLRAALDWLRFNGDAGVTLRMAASLWPLWLEHGAVTEGRKLLADCLTQPAARADSFAWARAAATLAMLVQAHGDHAMVTEWSAAALTTCAPHDGHGAGTALTARGLDAMVRGDFAQARHDLWEARNRFGAVGDPRSGSWALRHLASIAVRTGEGDALQLAEEGLLLVKEKGSALDVAKVLQTLGVARAAGGDLAGALRAWRESLALFRERGDEWGVADALSCLGAATCESGDAAWGLRLLRKALDGFTKIGDPEGIALTLGRIGWVTRALGDLDAAERHFDACLRLAHSSGANLQYVNCLYGRAANALLRREPHAAAIALRDAFAVPGLATTRPMLTDGIEWGAHLVAALGQPMRSAQILGAVTAFRDVMNVSTLPSPAMEREALIASLRSVLGDATFARAYSTGRGWPIPTALRAILDESASIARDVVARRIDPMAQERLQDDRCQAL